MQSKNTRFEHQKKEMCKITSELANPERENDAHERARIDEVNESDYARASNNLLSARKAFDETVTLMKATKGQLIKRREDEEKKREADFATKATRLMNALREMQIRGDGDGLAPNLGEVLRRVEERTHVVAVEALGREILYESGNRP